MGSSTVLAVHIASSDADAVELDRLTRQLRGELLATDAERVDLQPGTVSAGSKGVGAVALGGLVVEIARSAERLRVVVAAITSWVVRHSMHTVKIQIDGDALELTGVSTADQRALIDLWIARHSGPPDQPAQAASSA